MNCFSENNKITLSEIAHYGKRSFSIFQEFFASSDKILISGGRLSTRQ